MEIENNYCENNLNVTHLIEICQQLVANRITKDAWLLLLQLGRKNNEIFDKILSGTSFDVCDLNDEETLDTFIFPVHYYKECGFHCLRCNTAVRFFPRSIKDHTWTELYCACGSAHMFASATDYEIVTDDGADDYIDLSTEVDAAYFEHIEKIRNDLKIRERL